MALTNKGKLVLVILALAIAAPIASGYAWWNGYRTGKEVWMKACKL